MEGEPNKQTQYNIQNVNTDAVTLPVSTYNLFGDNNFETIRNAAKSRFNRESVERFPQRVYAYDSNYYGSDAKSGRNLQYYGL